MTETEMAYEVLIRARALCAASVSSERLKQGIDADHQFAFTFDGLRYGLEEFAFGLPGHFSYIDPACIV